jgi:hypothetical protein
MPQFMLFCCTIFTTGWDSLSPDTKTVWLAYLLSHQNTMMVYSRIRLLIARLRPRLTGGDGDI